MDSTGVTSGKALAPKISLPLKKAKSKGHVSIQISNVI